MLGINGTEGRDGLRLRAVFLLSELLSRFAPDEVPSTPENSVPTVVTVVFNKAGVEGKDQMDIPTIQSAFRLYQMVKWRITQWYLHLYYNRAWVMQLYFRLVPPSMRTWCALHRFKGVHLPAQNIWKKTIEDLKGFEAREEDVFIVTFPKAGTHMVVPLVSDVLWSKRANYEECKKFASSSADGHYPLFLEFGHPSFKALDKVQPGSPRVFQTHLPLNIFPQSALQKGCRIIYLTRDPRACTVSALHFCRNKRRKLYEPSVTEVVESEWKKELQIAGGWHHHVAEWVRLLQARDSSLILSFEDLVSNTSESVRSLCQFLAVEFSEEEIDAVVSRNTIHSRRKEASASDQKYYRQGAATVDAEWFALIPEESRAMVKQLCAARWSRHRMDELVERTPLLRRYAPKQKRRGDIRRIVLAGVGFHCNRIYVPPLRAAGVTLALVVDLDSQRDRVTSLLSSHGLEAERCVWLPPSARADTSLSPALLAALAAADADGLIVSSDPLAHEPYLRWALENDVDVLVDKPPTLPARFSLSEQTAVRIASEFDSVLRLAAASSANAVVMSQRRAHPGYRFIHSYLSSFVRQWQVPISYIDLYHADGMWCMPGEMCTREYHPFKYGYGKLMFSGYHFVDVLMWLLSINDVERGSGEPADRRDRRDRFRVRCAKFCPRDALEQLDKQQLQSLLAATETEVEESLREVPEDTSSLGDLNVHAVVQSLSPSGAVECSASLNLLHNSFSRRAWFQPRPDLYKGNGRVRHERLVVQVGPLLSLHLHSYQAGGPPDGSGQDASSVSDALLEECGLSRLDRTEGEERGDDSAYGHGHEEHFDVTIYRNTAVVGGPAVETIPIGKIMMQQEAGKDAGGVGGQKTWLGHNEKARHMLLGEWLRGGGSDLSPLVQQRETMQMLSRLYQDLAVSYADTK